MAGFKPGQKRPPNAGRKKGSLNKSTLLLRDILAARQIDIVEELLDLIPDLEPFQQVQTYLKLMEFAYPRLAAIQVQQVDANTPAALPPSAQTIRAALEKDKFLGLTLETQSEKVEGSDNEQ